MCGSTGKQFQSYAGQRKCDAWSASFVSFCAAMCDIPSTCIPKTSLCSEIERSAVSDSANSSWIKGPCQGSAPDPQQGDVAVFDWTAKGARADCVGVVTSFDSSTGQFDVVMGDIGSTGHSSSKVRMVTYGKSFPCVKGYVRLNWVSDAEV